MSQLTLTEINIYPVKSLGGVSLNVAVVEERGLQYDRRWMLVDESGVFISQRECAMMACIGVRFVENAFELFSKVMPENSFRIPFLVSDGEELSVNIWKDSCIAIHWNKSADEWLNELLNINCRLVYMPDSSLRNVDKKYTSGEEIVSFADGYPFLIIGEASLNDLNEKLEQPISMNRFRPNFVFSGGIAFEEDNWKIFQIGSVTFSGVKLCERCIITTIDQENASRSNEPLMTLSKYRKLEHKTVFGQNLIGLNDGKINVGDKIIVQEYL